MKVKKVRCLVCGTTLEADYDKGIKWAACEEDCPNQVRLLNTFRLSSPGSVVEALDKTKVQALDPDTEEWWFLIEPEDKNTPKYTEWVGRYGGGVNGFIDGLQVDFKTDPMTLNECRMHIKSNVVLGPEGRIYSLLGPLNIKESENEEVTNEAVASNE